jgi:chemotaxis protein methyltransferase CheR
VYQTQLHDDEFAQFQRWIHQTAGIDLSPAKKALVASRLSKRLCHYELESYGDYFSLIMNNRGRAAGRTRSAHHQRDLFFPRTQTL